MQNQKFCSNINAKQLTATNIAAINAILAKDQRVELIPTKDGVRVIHVKREEVK